MTENINSSCPIDKVYGESPTYTVAIINFGQDELIPGCLTSIRQQTILPAQIILVDNSGQLGHLDAEISGVAQLTFLQPGKNLGYAGGSNLALSLCQTEYILIINPDVLLESDYVTRILAYLERECQMAAVGGLLLRYDFVHGKKTNVVDSAGIAGSRSGRFWDRGQGSEWTGQYASGAVFGVSGAAALFRTGALRSVAVNGEVFDEDMLAYKEDIDIAWRLRSAGWSSAVVVEAVGYHGRVAGGSELGPKKHLAMRRKHTITARRLAFKNQILMLVKNGNRKELDFWRTIGRQVLIIGYICVFEPRVLAVVPQLLKQLPRMWAKRKRQNQHCRI